MFYFCNEMNRFPFCLMCFKSWCVKLPQVDCFDFDSDGDHDLIGSFTTTVLEMTLAATQPVCVLLVFVPVN